VDAARSLGHEGEIDFDLTEIQHRRGPDIHAELVDLLVSLFVVGEVVALDLLLFAVRSLPRSTYRDALRGILRDEVAHARFGSEVLRETREGRAEWLPYPGDDVLRESVARHVAQMRRRDVVHDDERAMFEDERLGRELLSLGVPVPSDFFRMYHRALDVSVPRALARAVERPGGAT
jgi:hypothetical protein